MEIKSHAKFLHLSPRKARLVLHNLRGEKAQDALSKLSLMPQKAAKEVSKVIKSAMANAEHNQGLSKTDLVIKDIRADQGPTFKRYKPRARGSADVIKKKMTHLSVVLESTTGKKAERKETHKETKEAKKVTKDTLTAKETQIKKEKDVEDKKPAPVEKEDSKTDSVEKEAVNKTQKPKTAKLKKKESRKPIKETKKQIKKDNSFMGGIKKFFRRKGL